jgi:hypothetical protein
MKSLREKTKLQPTATTSSGYQYLEYSDNEIRGQRNVVSINTEMHVRMYICMHVCDHKQAYSLRKGKKYSSQCRICTNITNLTVV